MLPRRFYAISQKLYSKIEEISEIKILIFFENLSNLQKTEKVFANFSLVFAKMQNLQNLVGQIHSHFFQTQRIFFSSELRQQKYCFESDFITGQTSGKNLPAFGEIHTYPNHFGQLHLPKS